MTASQSFAQTKQFATTYVTSAYVVGSTAGANDTDLATSAKLRSNVVLAIPPIIQASYTESFIELQYPAPISADVTTYIKIGMTDNSLLTGLIGGNLGNLVNNVVGVVAGQQGITVEAKNGATVAFASSSNFGQPRLRIVTDNAATPNYYIKVSPGATYDRIRIHNTVNAGLLSQKDLDVYGAFYVTGAPTCQTGTYTSYDATAGLVSLLGSGVTNIRRAIDGDASTFSRISLGTLAVGTYVEQSVYFDGPSSTSDKYNIKLKLDPSLLSLNINLLRQAVTIIAYKGGSQVYSTTLDEQALLHLYIGTDLLAQRPVGIQIAPGVAADRITVRYASLAGVGLTQNLDLYEVVKGDFGTAITINGGTAITGGASALLNQTVSLTASTTGCSNTGPYTYLWSTGATTATIPAPTNAAGDTVYTVTVTDAFGTKKTNQVTIKVLPPPVGGSIGNGQGICSGDLAPNLTLINYTGVIVRWEGSTSPTFAAGTIQNYTNTTAQLTGAEIGALNATKYIRAVVGNSGYADVYSSTATFTVKSTTWNGTAWSNGVPDMTTSIIISGNYNGTTNLDGCSLTVNNGAVVTIASDKTVTLNKFVNVATGSSFTLEHNAHLIQQTNAVNTGNITQKRNSSTLFRYDYTLWSSPVDGQQLHDFSQNTLNERFYEYGISNNAEYYLPVNPQTNFEAGKGYLIRMPNDIGVPSYYNILTTTVFTGIFTGNPHNGTITRPLSTSVNRWNAIGNPYPSPIGVTAFFDANVGVLQSGTALYFWRKKNNTNATSYATLTKVSYAANQASGGLPGENAYGGSQWTSFFQTTATADWVINPGQGFFVKTAANLTSPVVTFNNAMRRGNIHNTQFFRTVEPDQMSRMWINLAGTNIDAYSQISIAYTSDATLGLDYGSDGMLFNNGGNISLYTMVDDNRLTIEARPAFTDTDIVGLGYNAIEAGEFTFSLDSKDGVFADGQDIFLRDNLLGTITNITNGNYVFTTDAGRFNDRFELLYTTDALGTETPALNANTVIVFKEGSSLNINAGTAQISNVTVYDIRGRKLYSQNGTNATTATVTGLQAAQEVLIVEINTDKGTVSKKVVY
ncbi:hypothetical protein Q765_19140 [Flavobacterium rivuli WB 3.3-2 = DSM 21788]|uniref:Secretion system C-terminal sorting domain-containing protein n=1 Tax=Flavobacterium rivuli WB 3.3-2 = DSM 21788 TaxID=1121895 RepID=A0A0A2LY00_9FLAO|nr:hypothetical protein Q765_19140 [Flavobacterium rivuli WB 3.3-2 = DSM 21788]